MTVRVAGKSCHPNRRLMGWWTVLNGEEAEVPDFRFRGCVVSDEREVLPPEWSFNGVVDCNVRGMGSQAAYGRSSILLAGKSVCMNSRSPCHDVTIQINLLFRIYTKTLSALKYMYEK